MRQWSKKRQKRWREVEDWRSRFKEEVGRCEVCRKAKSSEHLDGHELCVGSVRQQALDKRFCVLVVCRPCHAMLESLTIPQQMAYLLLSRPEDYDLEAYYRLCHRRWPDHEVVFEWAAKLAGENAWKHPKNKSND